MSDIICHLSPTGGLDDRIAGLLNDGSTKEDISLLRGLYDMVHPDNPAVNPAYEEMINKLGNKKELSGDESDIVLKAMKKLMEFNNSQAQQRLTEMKNSTNHMAQTFNQLYNIEGWDETTRRNRINMVTTEFTNEVSRRVAAADKAGNPLTREQIINGHKHNGQKADGQFSIFEAVFNKLLDKYSEARETLSEADGITDEELREYYLEENKSKYEAENWSDKEIEKEIDSFVKEDRTAINNAEKIIQEYPKIFKNWAALCTFARMSLRDTEGLKLGQTLEYASPTSPNNYTNSPLEDNYDLEESVREAWMVHQRETSSFGSLGSEVKRFLSTITNVDAEGNKMRDDLGYTIKMDPLEMHRYLADILRGITSESSMIKKLKALSETDAKIKAVFEALAKASQVDLNKSIDDTNKPKNPVILTQLLEDMHKNLVPYSALMRMVRGAKQIYVKLLNKQENPLKDEFTLRMQLNQQLDNTAVYDSEGKVDWEKLAQWYVESQTLFPTPDKKDTDSKNILLGLKDYGKGEGFWSSNFSKAQRLDYIKRSAKALGVPMTDKAAQRIYNNPALRKEFLQSMQEFRTNTRNAIKGDIQKAYDDLIEIIKESLNNRNVFTVSGLTTEQNKKYTEALNSLKALNKGQGMSYTSFLEQNWGRAEKVGLEKINKALDILADVSNNLKTERRVSWFDRKGKANSLFSDRTPSYMGDLVDKIHEFVNEGDAEGLKSFIMNKWGQSTFFYKDGRFLNRWLQEMYDSITIDSKGRVHIDDNAFAKVFEFDEFLGSNIDKQVTIFENFTEKQHAESMMKQFVQKLDESRGKSKLAKYPCFILGDSGAQMFFTAKRYSQEEIMNGLKDVFQQEIERMNYVKATNEVLEKGGYNSIDNFSETADEFTMLKFLNRDFENGRYWKILTGNDQMTDAEIKKLSNQEAMEMAKSALNTDALTDALQAYMKNALVEFKDKLAAVGVLDKVKGEGDDTKYTDPKGYFTQNTQYYHNNIEEFVEDFFWNTKYATIEQLQMFTVDPAFYDHRYPVKDLQKRYKEIYAPGKGVSTEARDYKGDLFIDRDYERAVYFDDIEVSSEDVNPAFWKMIQETFKDNPKILDAYKKNTLTDGQGYRTLESYRAVKGMAGEWTIPMETAYQRIQSIRKSGQPLTENDIKEIARLAVVFQPIKPYLYTLEKLKINDEGNEGKGDMALIPVQHKYAEIVIIPELMQEGKLRDIALWMENHKDEKGNAAPIDLVASTKCVKVGAFGSTTLKGINTTEGINEALGKAYIHNLSWSDYRIQSGVPEHLNHAQLFGTQIRKLILGGINKGNPYNYLSNIFGKSKDPLGPTVNLPGMGNVHLNGNNLISLYNCLIMANLFDSYNKLADEGATNQKLSDKMIQNIISNANQNEDNAFAFSIIEEGMMGAGDFVIPLGEPGMEHDATSLLMSLFKKQVNKQKIKGGSAVQASAMGLSGWTDSGELFEMVSPEGDNVLYDEIEMPWNVSYTAAGENGKKGKNVPLRYEDWCITEGPHKGELKMSDQIVYGEDAREYLSWPVSGRNEYGRPNQVDENGYDPNGYYIPLIETKYKGILDIIAYRIPTERDYSMINCKVFRFSDPLSGGTMKVPSSRTTTAGFDFDIDKLYFFMREFAQTHLTDKQIEDIWNAIYEIHPEWKEALRQARDFDQRGEKAFGEIAGLFKNNMSGLGELNEQNKAKNRLYNYWESAGLEGTPEEAFNNYLLNHKNEYPSFDTYNPAVSPLENSRVARNNLLMDLIRQRLMDKETLKARYTPGGFENNRDAALRQRVLQFAPKEEITTNGQVDWAKVDRYVERINNKELKDPEPEYDVSDPTAILVYNQQNQVAGKLIGIFANQNTNHVYASTMAELRLVDPIKFGNHTQRGLYNMLKGPEGVDVDTNVAEYLAASVDAVKDPVLNFLNLNTLTADAGALLARIGYTPQEIGLLFNQPIIKDLCTYAANENVTTDVAISQMVKKYGNDKTVLSKIKYDSTYATTDRLATNIIQSRDNSAMSEAFKQGQLQVLVLFNELMADTADVNSFVQCTRFTAANSVGSTWGDQIAQQDRVAKFIEKYSESDESKQKKMVELSIRQQAGEDISIKDTKRLAFTLFDPRYGGSQRVLSVEEANMMSQTNQGILNMDENLISMSPEEYMAQMSRNPLAFEQCMYDMSRKATKELFGKHFPYYTELYTNMRKIMNRLTKYGSLDADTINSLHREFMVYLLSKQTGSQFDGEALSGYYFENRPLTNREYFLYYYPSLMYGLKSEGNLNSIPFFNAITFTGEIENMDKPVQMTIQGMGGLQASSTSLLTEMWADAVKSDAVVDGISVSEMAKNFYFYNYYRLGYNFHPTSSMSLAPTALKLDLRITNDSRDDGYIDYIKDIINGKFDIDSNEMINFAKQYILNHLDNKKLVFTPKSNARKACNGAYNESTKAWNSSFTVHLNSVDSNFRNQFLVTDDSLREGKIAWRPVLAIERDGVTSYYMAASNDAKFNVSDAADGSMTYRQVFAQGARGQQIQYFSSDAFASYQKDGSLDRLRSELTSQASQQDNTLADASALEKSDDVVETSFIQMGDDVSTMFSDKEWEQMFEEFKRDNTDTFSRDDMQGFTKEMFRKEISDTSDKGNVDILNDLSKRIERGEKMKTLNEDGKEIDVC